VNALSPAQNCWFVVVVGDGGAVVVVVVAVVVPGPHAWLVPAPQLFPLEAAVAARSIVSSPSADPKIVSIVYEGSRTRMSFLTWVVAVAAMRRKLMQVVSFGADTSRWLGSSQVGQLAGSIPRF